MAESSEGNSRETPRIYNHPDKNIMRGVDLGVKDFIKGAEEDRVRHASLPNLGSEGSDPNRLKANLAKNFDRFRISQGQTPLQPPATPGTEKSKK